MATKADGEQRRPDEFWNRLAGGEARRLDVLLDVGEGCVRRLDKADASRVPEAKRRPVEFGLLEALGEIRDLLEEAARSKEATRFKFRALLPTPRAARLKALLEAATQLELPAAGDDRRLMECIRAAKIAEEVHEKSTLAEALRQARAALAQQRLEAQTGEEYRTEDEKRLQVTLGGAGCGLLRHTCEQGELLCDPARRDDGLHNRRAFSADEVEPLGPPPIPLGGSQSARDGSRTGRLDEDEPCPCCANRKEEPPDLFGRCMVPPSSARETVNVHRI